MELRVCSRYVVLLPAMLIGLAAAQAQNLHRCGLAYSDPRTAPWMVQDKSVPVAPGCLPADAVLAVDLTSQMPPIGDQGQQGSCTSWAVGYYQKSHDEWMEYHWNLNQSSHQFSPAFLYNQINGGVDTGSDFAPVYTLISDQGCASLADCPYNQNDYTSWPSESAYARAIPNRGSTAHWFAMTDTTGINVVRQRLDNGYVTAIGIRVYGNFDNIQDYNYIYCVADTEAGTYRGDHAVTIIGYDDTVTTHDGHGVFKMMNSWGTGWGQSGFWWMSYVAARNVRLSFQTGYYLDDLNGYSPTMYGRVRITHQARDDIGIRLGVGPTASPLWSKDFRTFRSPGTDHAFPSHNMVFDMTEGEPYVASGQTDSVWVRAIDDISDGKTGSIKYFAGQHLVWNVTQASADTPVAIPDYNVPAYARALMTRPLDVGVVSIIAPADTVDSGTAVDPQARVRNDGTSAATFPVTFTIGAYSDTQNVNSLATGDSALVTFASWTALAAGTFPVTCSTMLSGDVNPANNAAHGSVVVLPFTGIAQQGSLPRAFALDRASPSPFTGFTTIRYAVPRLTRATLSVYSATGALVRKLQQGTLKPGYYSTVWDGQDGSGGLVPSGIYLYRLEAGNYSATGKVPLGR